VNSPDSISIILPAKNEAVNLVDLLPQLKSLYPLAEILVINDGSTDNTAQVAIDAGVKVISHPYNQGNGAAIKTGARNATGELLVFMDADGQHDPADIAALLEQLNNGYDMVVGARSKRAQATFLRFCGNSFFNRLASSMTGHKIEDLTSGFRAVRANKFRKFLYLLPNGFSYPTTSTMAFFRSGFPVAYIPIHAGKRGGKSHISLFKDGPRFFMIILKIGAFFSPMRLFLPISLVLFLTGLGYYGYTYYFHHRFSNMSALLLNTSILTFLMGIISEQISSLNFKGIDQSKGCD
jgi:glycosyltransferase involved in cell wall biosynthesis